MWREVSHHNSGTTMSKRDPRIDAYIKKAAPFAQPILKHIREVVHSACPDAEETMKWNSPQFMYNGSLLVGMAAFKEHCRLIFWKGPLIKGPDGENADVESIGKPASVADLPPKKVLVSYIKQGMKLNEKGVTLKQARVKKAKEVEAPDYFLAALKKNKKAMQTFDAFSPSHRREYIQWITEAKREDTRARRVAEAVSMISEGKPRNWKYM
jgi:uncharacterized protein YdeI (YjbR/CyaY-like superfamily)